MEQEYTTSILESMLDAVIVANPDGAIRTVNRAALELLGYAEEELLGQPVGIIFEEEEEAFFRGTGLAQLVREGAARDVELALLAKSGERIPVVFNGSIIREEDGRLAAVVGVARDIRERKRAEEALRQRTAQLEALRKVGLELTTELDLDTLLHSIALRAVELLGGTAGGLYLYRPERDVLEWTVPSGYDPAIAGIVLHRGEGLSGKVWEAGEPLIVDDYQHWEGRATVWEGYPIRATMGVPVHWGGQFLGVLSVDRDTTESFSPADSELLTMFAAQAAIAIHNARLYQQVQRDAAELEQRVAERTRELATLYDVTAVASEPLELQMTLERVLERVLLAMESDAGAIHLLDEADGSLDQATMRLVVQRGLPADLLKEIESMPPHRGAAWWVVEHNEPLLVPDVTSDPRTASAPLTEPWPYVGVPLQASGQTLGVLSLGRRIGRPQFNVEELSLLTSIADQLGIAVESARLRQRAEQAAVLEERERLGRDLHDSITQLLYSMNLFARSAQNAYHLGDMQELNHCLTELGEIGQQALREMRLLVFQLRPSALEQDGLIGALRRRLDTVEGRLGVATQLLAGEAIALPGRIEEGLYHIAMEALNNALKHAQATSLTVSIDADKERVHLEVADDGCGFDLHAVEGKGGLGLVNMHERADRLGGALTIASTPGEGTKVKITVPYTHTD